MSLPGTVPAKLAEIYQALPAGAREAFRTHLLGGTSSERLSQVLIRHGYPIGATTLKVYRRHLKEIGYME